ncbi:MAG TPA: YoaK family protein [Dyella sp.]|uniref:YoaK family protein n=1 Tax=Dyella sp. TaxID=1869338 RepID=UPI002D778EEA|nr:YoaK family protein [Dyella sp.]HET6552795.1 YoaK family protein [Dyella sp.]
MDTSNSEAAPLDTLMGSPADQGSEQGLRVAVLLSMAGGFLDAFTWVGHGGVFANAQTGNVVLLGLSLAAGHWQRAIRHLLPIVAFFGGVFVAHRIRSRASRTDLKTAAIWTLGFEIALLIVVAFLPPTFPSDPVIIGIAFVAALQTASFNKVEGLPYSSVMTTGNLRRSAESLFDGLLGSRNLFALRQSRIFGTICATFCLGALIGGFLTSRLGNRALVFVVITLLVVYTMCRPRRLQGGSEEA